MTGEIKLIVISTMAKKSDEDAEKQFEEFMKKRGEENDKR